MRIKMVASNTLLDNVTSTLFILITSSQRLPLLNLTRKRNGWSNRGFTGVFERFWILDDGTTVDCIPKKKYIKGMLELTFRTVR
jgi:hypothetical protein